MSSHPNTRELSREQQTLYEASAAEMIHSFPRGIILRVELPNDRFEEFLNGNLLITYVMINFSDVFEVLEKYGTLRAVLEPWQIPIVTATEDDELLRNRTRDNIRHVLNNIQPAIYIPDTGTVYIEDDHDPDKQLAGIIEYKTRLRWLIREIEKQGWAIRLLPLAKGQKQWHFEEYLDLFDRHSFTEFAFYTRQYCGGTAGNAIDLLVDHINNFITVVDPDNVLAVARHGRTHLEKLPPRVTGASGLKQFIERCSDVQGKLSQDMFAEWKPVHEDALFANHDHNRPKLTDFNSC